MFPLPEGSTLSFFLLFVGSVVPIIQDEGEELLRNKSLIPGRFQPCCLQGVNRNDQEISSRFGTEEEAIKRYEEHQEIFAMAVDLGIEHPIMNLQKEEYLSNHKKHIVAAKEAKEVKEAMKHGDGYEGGSRIGNIKTAEDAYRKKNNLPARVVGPESKKKAPAKSKKSVPAKGKKSKKNAPAKSKKSVPVKSKKSVMTKTPVPVPARIQRTTAKKVAYADDDSDDESMEIDENANLNMFVPRTKRAKK